MESTVPERLIGIQRHTIDEKNRTFIPAKFRAKLGDTIFVTKSFSNKCLRLYSKSGFDNYVEEMISKLPQVREADVIAWLGSSSEEIQVDAQGRIAIPLEFRKYAGLDKNVVSSGAFTHVNLWDEQTFDEHDQAMNPEKVHEALATAERQKANPEWKGKSDE